MTDLQSAPAELLDLIFLGLDHGIESIKAGGPLIAFTICETNGEKNIQRFVTEKIEDGKREAEEYLRKLDPNPEYAIIAYDGYISFEGEKYDAILVEGFDKNQKEGYIVGQRYTPKTLLKSLKTIGNPAFIGNEPNILTR